MMDIRQEIASRLRKRRHELGMTVDDVSRLVPDRPSASRYSHWEKGERLPKMEQLIELARALQVSPSYICGFTSDMRDYDAENRQFITLADAHITQASGNMFKLPSDRSVAFNIDTLADAGLRDHQLILLVAPDTSMAPAIQKGDKVLVDRDQRIPDERDIFALLVKNNVWFRWIRPELDGSFTVQAEDGDVTPPTKIEADALESLCIIGRVAGLSRFR